MIIETSIFLAILYITLENTSYNVTISRESYGELNTDNGSDNIYCKKNNKEMPKSLHTCLL